MDKNARSGRKPGSVAGAAMAADLIGGAAVIGSAMYLGAKERSSQIKTDVKMKNQHRAAAGKIVDKAAQRYKKTGSLPTNSQSDAYDNLMRPFKIKSPEAEQNRTLFVRTPSVKKAHRKRIKNILKKKSSY